MAFKTVLSGDLAGDDKHFDCSKVSNCCVEHDEWGCDDPTCEAIICDILPGCCSLDYEHPHDFWDYFCVERARFYCCEPFFHNCENSYHVVTASGTDRSAVLDGFTIAHGYADVSLDYGGGLRSIGGSATLSNCIFRNNGGRRGPGIFADDGADLALRNCLFLENFEASGSGAGIDVWGSVLSLEDCVFYEKYGLGVRSDHYDNPGTLALTRCAFLYNEEGALWAEGNVTMTDCSFIGNSGLGSTVELRSFPYGSHMKLDNCSFMGNSSYYPLFIHYSWATISDCRFIGNIGGSVAGRNSVVTMNNSQILGNTGDSFGFAESNVTVSNSIFSGNGRGALSASEGELNLINCTVANTDLDVGERVVDGYRTEFNMINSIIWGTTGYIHGLEDAQIDLYESTVNINYSAIEGWSGKYGGVGNSGVDPLFVDPAGPDGVYGTSDDDLRLSVDSPLINAGDPAFVALPCETDLGGNPRLQGCRVDLGAYESDVEQDLGDFDGDGDIDLQDFARFLDCHRADLHNPDWLDTCLCVFDALEDSAVDTADIVSLREALTGPT
ncbi:MAG: right-handed parallel beta-helix repeat-containing protein [Phycisphaerales bacterium]|nr:MAG: right-handed parallel beta-helix repeat-containing protein [Phycisphaerales bacterium]